MCSPPNRPSDDLTVRVARLEEELAQVRARQAATTLPDGASLAQSLSSIASDLRRLADHFAPAPGDKVGTPYVARALAQTTTWVAEMARTGIIPKHCVVEGTGNGRPWKFHRTRIDEWIRSR